MGALLDGRIGVHHLINRHARAVGERHLAHGIEAHRCRARKAGQIGRSSTGAIGVSVRDERKQQRSNCPGVYLPPEAARQDRRPRWAELRPNPPLPWEQISVAPAGNPEYWTKMRVPVSAFRFCGSDCGPNESANPSVTRVEVKAERAARKLAKLATFCGSGDPVCVQMSLPENAT